MNLFKSLLAAHAPKLATLVGGPLAGIVTGLVVKKLGLSEKEAADPDALIAAIKKPGAGKLLAAVEKEHAPRLEKYALKLNQTTQETMRLELSSQHGFARNWRPFFGYVCSITFFIQFLLICGALFSAVWQGDEVLPIISAMAQFVLSTTPLWGIALAVLGVSTVQRTKEKMGGNKDTGIAGKLISGLLSNK